jgi:ceramide glucosyltransferase
MAAHAHYECLLVSDSDIRVAPGYLTGIMSQLQQQSIGLVTCLYRGVPASTLGSRLESIGISTDFAPGVLVARALENELRFGLGSTLAFRRSELAAIGGFEALADYLADDYQIGKRISDLGLKVALSTEVVETLLPPYSFAEFMRHQLRWNRTVRDSRYWGFAGLILTFALPWVLLADLFSRGAVWAWALTCFVICLRLAVAIVVGKVVLTDDYALSFAWLIPLRDVLAVFFWAASFAGNTVLWRGERFHLRKGKLSRIRT